MPRTAVIVDVVRTPSGRGKPGGALSGIHPVDLAAGVLRSVLERNGLESRQIDDVLLGCVSQVGDQAMNIARQAVLAAGFDESVPATTIDRQCGSSQQAAHFAAQGVIAGAYDIVIAGGVESMSRVPLGSSRAGGSRSRAASRERYPDGLVNQGVSAELIAQKWGFVARGARRLLGRVPSPGGGCRSPRPLRLAAARRPDRRRRGRRPTRPCAPAPRSRGSAG